MKTIVPMTDDVYNDLKKYSGKIIATTPKNPTYKHDIISEPASVNTDMTIDQIINMIKPPFIPVRDTSGIVHDKSTIAIKCIHMHMHKYYVHDIIRLDGQLECATCSSGNLFTSTVRELIESILCAPFVASTVRWVPGPRTIEYMNPFLKIILLCCMSRGDDSASTINGFLLIKFCHTTSLKKIKLTAYKYLHNYHMLTENQRTQISLLSPAPAKPIFYKKDPLAFSPELACMMTSKQLNIVDDESLYFENCTEI